MDLDKIRQDYGIEEDEKLVLHIPARGGRSPHVEVFREKGCNYGSVDRELNELVLEKVDSENYSPSTMVDLEEIF